MTKLATPILFALFTLAGCYSSSSAPPPPQDFAVVLDVSLSMTPFFEPSLGGLYDAVGEAGPDARFALLIIGRDGERFLASPFETIPQFLARLEHYDEPFGTDDEMTLDAIDATSDLAWRLDASRTVLVISDEVAQGTASPAEVCAHLDAELFIATVDDSASSYECGTRIPLGEERDAAASAFGEVIREPGR